MLLVRKKNIKFSAIFQGQEESNLKYTGQSITIIHKQKMHKI